MAVAWSSIEGAQGLRATGTTDPSAAGPLRAAGRDGRDGRGRPPVLRVVRAPVTDPSTGGADWGVSEGETLPLPYIQGRLAVDFRRAAEDSFFGPQATTTPDLPEPGPWAHRMIQAMLEVCDGSRSATQLSRWVVPEIRDRIARRGQLARQRGRRMHRPPVVRALLTCLPADGVVEISAAVQVDGRVRALALRLNGADGRWVITAWELG